MAESMLDDEDKRQDAAELELERDDDDEKDRVFRAGNSTPAVRKNNAGLANGSK